MVKMSFLYDLHLGGHNAIFSSAISIWAAFVITICFSKDKLCHLWLRCPFYMTDIWVHIMQCFPVLFL